MLSKEVFKKGLEEIQKSFANFKITEDKITIWYKYSKHLEDSMWEKKITNCIKGCRKIPTLADVLDIKGYYSDNSVEYKCFEPEEDDYEYKPMSDDIKKMMHDSIKKSKMPNG
jgi:hypothetical protein